MQEDLLLFWISIKCHWIYERTAFKWMGLASLDLTCNWQRYLNYLNTTYHSSQHSKSCMICALCADTHVPKEISLAGDHSLGVQSCLAL